MTADEPNDADASTIAAIKDFFMSYLVKKQLRHAAWFSRIGEIHANKAPEKITEGGARARHLLLQFRRVSFAPVRMPMTRLS